MPSRGHRGLLLVRRGPAGHLFRREGTVRADAGVAEVAAEDVAQVVTFLCSPLAISITGEAISVSGGVNADMHY